MGAPNDYFVRPSTGSDAADGLTHANGWKTKQHALDTIVQDVTDGDRINMNSEADDVLSAVLDYSNYGSPSNTAPLITQGYTATVGDGGKGGLSGGGSVGLVSGGAIDGLTFKDMHLHNCGAAQIIDMDNFAYFENCEIDNTSGGGLRFDIGAVLNCYIHNIGANGIRIDLGGLVYRCVVADTGGNTMGNAMQLAGSSRIIALENIIHLNSTAGIGINVDQANIWVIGNSVFNEAAGTNSGIDFASNLDGVCLNNLAEGWSGSGGIGAKYGNCAMVGGNAFFNCETDTTKADVILDLGADESL